MHYIEYSNGKQPPLFEPPPFITAQLLYHMYITAITVYLQYITTCPDAGSTVRPLSQGVFQAFLALKIAPK